MEEPESVVAQPVSQPVPAAEESPKEVELPPSRWDSPRPTTPERPTSPEPNCAICLGVLENKSFTNSCMHQFCFVCLLEWSKVKAECPLCKNSFRSIIHNVRSMEDYDQYEVFCPNAPVTFPINVPHDTVVSRMNRSTWVSSEFLNYRDMLAIPSGHRPTALSRRDRNVAGTSAFRRYIYDEDLWARLQPDVTGRYRECSPQFYRQNPAQLHRLVPFLQRELNVLLTFTGSTPEHVDTILSKLRHHRINGREFRTHMRSIIGPRHSVHFCHELLAFASSPFDLIGYDRTTEHLPNNNNNFLHPDLVEVIEDTPSTSETEGENSDNEVQMLSRTPSYFSVTVTPHGESTSVDRVRRQESHSSSPQPGPSGMSSSRVSEQSPSRRPRNCDSSVLVVDDSDSDDCTVVGVVKPRHERTPLIITLSSPEHSPESPQPGPSGSHDPDATPPSGYPPGPEESKFLDQVLNSSDSTANSPLGHGKRKPRLLTPSGSDSDDTSFNPSRAPWLTDSESDSDHKLKPREKLRRTDSSACTNASHKTPASVSSENSASGSQKTRSSPKVSGSRGDSSSSTSESRPRILSVATRVSSHRPVARVSVKYRYADSDDDDEEEPSTSYEAQHRPQRLYSVLQRTLSTTGEDIWTVHSGRTSRRSRGGSGNSPRFSSPDYNDLRKYRSSDRSESSCSSHSRHVHRDSSSRSKKKHKKRTRSKSKKRKHEPSRRDRCKKSRHGPED